MTKQASVKQGKLTDYVPNPRNHNQGSERGQGMIESSLRKYGAGRSLVVDKKGTIIAGNHTQEAAADIGLEDVIEVETNGKQIVVVKRTDLDLDNDVRAIELAYIDNRSSEVSLNWDAAQIVADLEGGIDLSEMFYEDELAAIISELEADKTSPGEDSPPDMDQAEELLKKWAVTSGSLWAIGEHRLLCGDCRKAEDVARLFGKQKAQIAFTSPPYAQQRQADYGGVAEGEYVDWFEAVQSLIHQYLTKDGSFFLNIKAHSQEGERVLYVMDLVLSMKRQWGWHFIDEFCWTHQTAPGAWNFRFRNGFEPIYHFAKATKSKKFYPKRVGHFSEDVMVGTNKTGGAKKMSGTGDYYNVSDVTAPGIAQPDNVLRVQNVEMGIAHSAMFPTDLPTHFIQAFTDKGDIVYEPFLGSGTSLIACEEHQRICYGMEILPKYVALTLERAERHGKQISQLE